MECRVVGYLGKEFSIFRKVVSEFFSFVFWCGYGYLFIMRFFGGFCWGRSVGSFFCFFYSLVYIFFKVELVGLFLFAL